MTPYTIVARRLQHLINQERQAIYQDLLAEEQARHALETATAEAAVEAFGQLSTELGGSWGRRDATVTWAMPDLALKAQVAVAFGKDDRPHLVVHLGTIGKAIWVEPDAPTIANGVVACVTELIASADWRREMAIQLRGDARAEACAAACASSLIAQDEDILALPVREPNSNGRMALSTDVPAF